MSVDAKFMQRAIDLAAQGEGFVEPNPMVGCVVVRDGRVVGEGWHERMGGPHAEVAALRAAGDAARGATLFVSLEPCCHHGKTPPCTDAILAAGIRRVVAAQPDPFPLVQGGGLQRLRDAGLLVEVGLMRKAAEDLNAPYLKLVKTGRPWVIAKWAMTLDGKIATRTGDSRWISNEASREFVHALRGRVDAVVVGRGTAERDDPMLTARPTRDGAAPLSARDSASTHSADGATLELPRVATRIVLDSRGRLSGSSKLVQTARQIPVLVVVCPETDAADRRRLQEAGCEVLEVPGASSVSDTDRFAMLLDELGRRRMTNVLVEGGGQLLGAAFDAAAVDEVHVFIASRIVGGADAVSPVRGLGALQIGDARSLTAAEIRILAGDVHVHGRLAPRTPKSPGNQATAAQ